MKYPITHAGYVKGPRSALFSRSAKVRTALIDSTSDEVQR
jgi:hypothetical protein